MRNNKGFSLVELIVVIAIMAILAAVAVVGFSMYIPKAQKAADDQVISDINYIFDTVCSAEGIEKSEITAAEWNSTKDNWGLVSVNGETDSKLVESFKELYDVEKVELKYYKTIVFDKNAHCFVGSEQAATANGSYSYGDKTYNIEVDRDDMTAFNESSFKGIGVENLMNQMDSVIDFAQGKFVQLDGDGLAHLRQDADFIRFCNQYPEYATGDEDTKTKIEMLALVQYTALKSADRDADALYDQFVSNPGGYQMGEDGLDIVANATMYSLGLSFAQTDAGEKIMKDNGWDPNTAEGIYNLMQYKPMGLDEWNNPVEDPNAESAFGTWLKNNEETAKNDIAGFQGAMGMLNDNESNFDPDMLLNGGGFGNEGFVSGLEDLLGND